MTGDGAPVPRRALAVGAHPDDIEFGCGATLARWARDGCDVQLLVLTDGSKGTWDAGADPGDLATRRRAEQERAAAALGASAVHHLGRVDGELVDGRSERSEVCRWIRTVRPEVVLGHDPWKRYRLHPDHRRAGFLTLDAVVAARDPHFFADQAVGAHRPGSVFLFEAEEEDHVEPADEESLAAKVAALLEHRSQWRSTMSIDEGAPADERRRQIEAFEGSIRSRMERPGPDGRVRLVESFKRLDDL